MMKNLNPLIILVFLFVFPIFLNADPRDYEIDIIMSKLEQSYDSGDDSYAISIMYEPIVDYLGGKKFLLSEAKKTREKVEKLKLKAESWQIIKPYQYITTDKRIYVIIPVKSAWETNGQMIIHTGYQLGIKSKGKNWRFVNGESLTDKAYKYFFPDFPESIELPTTGIQQ